MKNYLIVAALLLGACTRSDYTVLEGNMLGTTYRVVSDVAITPEEMARLDAEMQASMSIFDETSLLNCLNRNETETVDRHITYNLALAQEIGELSDGYYDVTVKPLVDAWGFSGKKGEDKPNVDSLLQLVGFRRVFIHNGKLRKEDPRIQLDFNSIAKGYTVDQAAEILESKGAENYLVEIGGECRAKGVNREGKPWRVGIETPPAQAMRSSSASTPGGEEANGGITTIVHLTEHGLATSGNYRRFRRDHRGNKIAHTLDPHTGRSVQSRLLSATVVAETAARADAMATMFMSMGHARATAFVKAHPESKVVFIFDNETWISPAMKDLVKR